MDVWIVAAEAEQVERTQRKTCSRAPSEVFVPYRSPEERRWLFQAVHDALMEAFRIPDDDRTQRIVEHEPENFEIPPGSSNRYTLIEITAFPGRSAEAKRNLYRSLVQRLGEIAIDPMDVSVVVLEPKLESWGVRGGRSAADVDLGFSLDV